VATPGPWWDDEGAIAYERRPGDKRYVACDHEHHGCCSAEDAEFIAHAREDVPALVAEIRRLRAERDGLKRTQTVNAARVLGPPG
jgi:hypothetical protein